MSFMDNSFNFRYRIILSILTHKTINLDKKLRPEQHSFIELVTKIAPASKIVDNKFEPGAITKAEFTLKVDKTRSLSYYFLPLIPLLPFCAKNSSICLIGSSRSKVDLSIPALMEAAPKVAALMGLPELTFTKDSNSDNNSSLSISIVMKCGILKRLPPIIATQEQLVSKIRGQAFAAQVSPSVVSAMVCSARALLTHILPDVWISSDRQQKALGYGLTLWAEYVGGQIKVADLHSHSYAPNLESCLGIHDNLKEIQLNDDIKTKHENLRENSNMIPPEIIGREVASRLLNEIESGGVVCSTFQPILLLCMACTGDEDISKIRLGKLSPISAQLMRDIYDISGLKFQIHEDSTSHVPATYEGITEEDIESGDVSRLSKEELINAGISEQSIVILGRGLNLINNARSLT